MLARTNRITKPSDFRRTLGSGVRVIGASIALHAEIESEELADNPAKIGFIVGKACGSAVVRNRIKRRLKSISRSLLGQLKPGTLVVIRALPTSGKADFQALHDELTNGFRTLLKKLERRSPDV